VIRFYFLEVPILSINQENECSEGFIVSRWRDAFRNAMEDVHGHLVHDENVVASIIKPGPSLVLVKINKILDSLAIFS